MDHLAAVQTSAVERYLLDELPDPEREEFEQHYFDCRICAEEVRLTAMFVDNATAVLRRPVYQPQRASLAAAWAWFRPQWATALAAVSSLFAAYQYLVVIPSLHRAVPQLGVIGPLVRGEGRLLHPDPNRPNFALGFEVNVPPSQTHLLLEFRLRKAGVTLSPPVHRVESDHGDRVVAILPTSRFPDGAYEVTLRGRSSARGPWSAEPLQHYEFQLAHK
jgi:hypothetical protein